MKVRHLAVGDPLAAVPRVEAWTHTVRASGCGRVVDLHAGGHGVAGQAENVGGCKGNASSQKALSGTTSLTYLHRSTRVTAGAHTSVVDQSLCPCGRGQQGHRDRQRNEASGCTTATLFPAPPSDFRNRNPRALRLAPDALE